MVAHRRVKVTLVLRVGLLFAGGLVGDSVLGQGGRVNLAVDDPRPVASAVLELMQRHPVVITYEDAVYAYTDDIKDVTEEVRNPASPRSDSGYRVLVPVGGPLHVSYDVSSQTNKPADLAAVLSSITQSKNSMPTGGRFRIVQAGDVFHVIASQERDAGGRWIDHASPLDLPITLTTEKVSGSQAIEAILKEVASRTGVEFTVITMGGRNLMSQFNGAVQAQNEVARDVLLRTLQSMNHRLSWLMYYDVSMKRYFFNVVAASAEQRSVITLPENPPTEIKPGDPTPTGVPFGEQR
jgi:hypothetical protein